MRRLSEKANQILVKNEAVAHCMPHPDPIKDNLIVLRSRGRLLPLIKASADTNTIPESRVESPARTGKPLRTFTFVSPNLHLSHSHCTKTSKSADGLLKRSEEHT